MLIGVVVCAGAWVTASQLEVTITAALASPTAAQTDSTAVGRLRVAVRATGGLVAAAGTSPVSNSSALVEAGSWGDALLAADVTVRSYRELEVSVVPPSYAAYAGLRGVAYSVGSYMLVWTSPSPPWNGSLTVGAAFMPATIGGLATGVPVRVRVACVTLVAAGVETLSLRGPWTEFGSPVAPALPQLRSFGLASGVLMVARGGETVLLYGSFLGLHDGDVSARYASARTSLSSGPCTVRSPGRLLACTTVAGVGRGYVWSVTVNGGASSVVTLLNDTASLAYEQPVISAFDGPGVDGASTRGGQAVVIRGSQFGPLGGAYLDLVQYRPSGYAPFMTAANCSVTREQSEITCYTVPGAGGQLSWVLVIANQSSTTPSTRYAVPTISALRVRGGGGLSALRTAGGDVVVLVGEDFGPATDFIAARNGHVELLLDGEHAAYMDGCNVTVAHTEVACAMPPGVGAAFAVRVMALGQVSARSSQLLSYSPPRLLGVLYAESEPQSLPTAGGARWRLNCTDIGGSATLVQVVLCPAAVLSGGCVPVTVTSMPKPDTLLEVTTPPLESTLLLATGLLHVALRVGPPGAPDAVRTSNFVPAPVRAPTLGRDAQGYPYVSVDFIEDLRSGGALSPGQAKCIAAAPLGGGGGGSAATIVVTLVGTDFGVGAVVTLARVPGNASLPCITCFSAHATAMCWTSYEVGVLAVSLRAGGQATVPVELNLTSLVKPPSLVSVGRLNATTGALVPGPVVLGTREGARLLVRGQDFRNTGEIRLVQRSPGRPLPTAFGPGDPVCVVVPGACFGPPTGAQTCGWGHDPSSSNLRDSLAVCDVPPGSGDGWYVVMEVRLLAARYDTPLNYRYPTVARVSPPVLPARGAVVDIVGADFGPPGAEVSVSIGGVPCGVSERDYERIACVALRGTAAAVELVVTVGGLQSASFALGYHAPVVTRVDPSHGNSSGGAVLLVAGEHFGADAPPNVTFALPQAGARSGMTVTVRALIPWADDSLRVVAPNFVDDGGGLVLTVSTGAQLSAPSAAARFFIDPPALLGLSVAGARPIAGGFTVTLTGANLYGWLANFLPAVSFVVSTDAGFEARPCALVAGSVTPGSVSCVAPPGVGAGLNVSLSLLGRTAVLHRSLAYDPPAVAAVEPLAADARLSNVLRISGGNFASGPAFDVRIGGFACASLQVCVRARACVAARISACGYAVMRM